MIEDPTKRFSNRVDDYVKSRPSYPAAALDLLSEKCGLNRNAVVADVGAGTGLLTELMLTRGAVVFAVEPNKEMRAAAERRLGRAAGFVSRSGTAEATGLPEGSVDLVTAAQAFHWFDRAKAKAEFARVLKPGGVAAILFNDRLVDATPFLQEYERALRACGTDYVRAKRRNLSSDDFRRFFEPFPVREASFSNRQDFDLAGLRGRAFSSSYAPAPGQPGRQAMVEALEKAFAAHEEDGAVTFHYATRVFFGAMRT